jgi:hypothetical protein
MTIVMSLIMATSVCFLIQLRCSILTSEASDPFETHYTTIDEKTIAECIKDSTHPNSVVKKFRLHSEWKATYASYRSNPSNVESMVAPFPGIDTLQVWFNIFIR